jgi:PmbA protein
MARQATYALDSLTAAAPQAYTGPVIMRERTLGIFLNSDVIQTMASASAKYNQLTTWEVGKPVFKTAAAGDPFNAWANRCLPYGLRSGKFDDEGLPGQRIPLIQDNLLVNFTASQRYASYMKVPATGDFGNLELAPGAKTTDILTSEPHIEIAGFSWFNPDSLTGDFSCEIRLGYLVDGDKRIPFKGGQLVGNVMDALSNVHWSKETGFFGDYQGPVIGRFEGMQVAA